ncbi:3bd73db5-ff9e-43b1-9d60-34538f75ab5e [Sclerotinia trifoliorum]|uniref:Protein BTN n=1 Tax=Sclerotinia trifoliorum TaxID=28548 RepID=A0A8H2VVY7_9HELO|nr:3bd73db5-ff9e-43b1-9d60-34538f75ab5e [Sclerotinia trifoliorum]
MNRSASSTGIAFPLPGSPGSSWAMYRARFKAIFHGADTSVLMAFWLFGLINNVLYVIILSAALDLVGPSIPKSVVLLADVMPSFVTKLIAPYFIHKIPYWIRILIFCGLSSGGMLLIALTPTDKSVSTKLFGVILASLSSGGGELSFLGLTHYYGHFSLAAWGSGTGGAGLAGAGLYVLLTTIIGLSVKTSLLASAFLPCIMLLSFFVILPRGPLKRASIRKDYNSLPGEDSLNGPLTASDIEDLPADSAAVSLLAPGPAITSEAYSSHSPRPSSPTLSHDSSKSTFLYNFHRASSLFFPYMLPLLLVYIAEYTINQGVSPTLLYLTPSPGNPFSTYRSFYPTYGFIYQLGVFISRSSTPFYRIHNLYLPSFLQIANLFLLISQALWFWIPSVYIIFIIIFWEGLLGGAVYVNTFAEIMEKVDEADREFSLGATSVSDSGGICVAGFLGMVLEVGLCQWQVEKGRSWCRTG